MNRDNLKPALSYEEQLKKLEMRGLNVENKQIGVNILRVTNYYRLSGYSLGLRDENDIFVPRATLRHIYNLYLFDEEFRHLIFSIIEPIELRLRAEIAYSLGTRYGNVSHLDPYLFKDKSKYLAFLAKYYDGLSKTANLAYIEHNLQTYGELPIWVAVETLTFGTLSKFYGNLKNEIRSFFADAFHSDNNRLPGWFESLCEVRNVCAHSARIYNRQLKLQPKLYKDDNEILYKGNADSIEAKNLASKIFPRLIVIKKIYDGKGKWGEFMRDLRALISKYESFIDMHHLGFPRYWISELDKYYPHTNYAQTFNQ